ncbi:MAG: hypothetical protein U0800_26690 [Isosphaeraceae bacterium]
MYRRLAEAAERIRALTSDGGPADNRRIEEARRRIASAIGFVGLLADQERLLALRDAEEALVGRLGHDPAPRLLAGAVGLASKFRPSVSCGLLIGGAVAASDGWEESFRAWHAGPGLAARRCPLLAVGGPRDSVRVDRIASAQSWPEWRAAGLAHGRRSAMALALPGGRGALLFYSRTPGFTDGEIEAARRIARLAARILQHAPSAGP